MIFHDGMLGGANSLMRGAWALRQERPITVLSISSCRSPKGSIPMKRESSNWFETTLCADTLRVVNLKHKAPAGVKVNLPAGQAY